MRNARLCITSAVIYMIDYEEILQQIPVNTFQIIFVAYADISNVCCSRNGNFFFQSNLQSIPLKTMVNCRGLAPCNKEHKQYCDFFFKYYIVIWRGKKLDLNVCNCYTGNELIVLGCAVSLL